MNILPSMTDEDALKFADPANPEHAAELFRRFEAALIEHDNYTNETIANLEDENRRLEGEIERLEEDLDAERTGVRDLEAALDKIRAAVDNAVSA